MQFKMNAILQVAYRKGAVATGLDLEGASVIRNGEETFVVADLHPLGNGTYRGMLSVILRSAEGLCLDSSAVPCQVEIADLRRRVPLKNIPVGRYRLTVESNQERPVSPGGRIIPAVPLRRTYDLVATERGITLAEREF
ncbi:MAG TPA: hypothetical protein VHI13_17955 [Candidatus Kapabacteria bacterium]|nr:hypothetical protein [Candidatus Kapabacteria bacterium]